MRRSPVMRALASGPPSLTIAEIVAAHPWPREFAGARRLEWLWTIDVPASPGLVWPLVADLARMNRALGLPLMMFTERDGIRWGAARYTGVMHEWVEVPWNWVAGRWYELVRVYKKGAMRALHSVYQLEPRESGTRVHIYYGIVPRSRIFDLALKWSFGAMGRAYKRLFPRVADELTRSPDAPPCLKAPAPRLPAEASERLDRLATTLTTSGLDADAVHRLVDWIRTATDDELERIRVIERARAWSIDEDQLLRVCLHATRAGLLDLTWDVVCPHCRGVREATGALVELPSRGECEACGIAFGTDSLEAIEITFHAHSSIRPIERGVYCSAEPAHKPHIHVQHAVEPGATAEVAAPSSPGRYRLRLRGDMRGAWLGVAPDAPAALDWSSDALPVDPTLAPGGTIRLTNNGASPATFVVETAAWLEHALRPGRLLSFQDFRDLFGEEYLASGVQLAVGEQTILFTDLVGSTAMYSERGDPAAFVEVKKHFTEVFAIVGAHRGAVVKTIGDAVMAAFNAPLDAVRAARAIHDAFPPRRGPNMEAAGFTPAPGNHALRLRISLNSGPCIAVRLNAAIDYFGHVVNLAAKLQSAAEAWQVALSDTTHAAPGVADYLAEQNAELEDVALDLKGIDTPVHAKRWTVARE